MYRYLLLLLLLVSCSRKVYQRPITIDHVEISNSAGPVYERQFGRVNRFYMQRFDSLQRTNQLLVFDTTRTKRKPHKLNYTLVSSLDTLNLNGLPGVYHQLYFRPNNGKGKTKSGALDDRYIELKLFSPQKSFLQHTEVFYRDSLVSGASSRIIPAHLLYQPDNRAAAEAVSFRVSEISFYKGLNKQQQNSIIRILNNAIVLRQRRQNKSGKGFTFSAPWLPNYHSDAPATFLLTVKVTEDESQNRIRLDIHYQGDAEPPQWLRSEAAINRRDFLDGHLYEANSSLSSWVNSYISNLYYAATRKK